MKGKVNKATLFASALGVYKLYLNGSPVGEDYLSPGCGKIDFVPCLDTSGKITSAQGHYDTDFGRVAVNWERNGDTYTYSVTVPAQIECTFAFGDMTVKSETKHDDTYIFVLKV